MGQFSSLSIRCFESDVDTGYDSGGRDNLLGIGADHIAAFTYQSDTPFAVLTKTLQFGMRTDAPNTTVDIDGDFATRWRDVVCVDGQNDDIDIGEFSSSKVSSITNDITITGIANGYDGKELALYFPYPAFKLTITDDDSSSLAGNRIYTFTGQDLEFKGDTVLRFKYYDDHWLFIGSSSQLENKTFRFTTREVKLYSLGVIQRTHAEVMIFERWDTTNDEWVAQYGFLMEYEEQGTDTYGYNSFVMFHKIGTEKGNCFITGLSPASPPTPDYWFSAITQFKHGTVNTDVFYYLAFKQWSEDQDEYLVQRPLQVANVKPRIYVAGRFHCLKTIGGNFGPFTWHTLATNPWPMSEIECYIDTDLGMLGASAVAPTLIGNLNDIEIDFGPRLKPVTLMAQGWGENLLPINNNQNWQIGLCPVENQQTTANRARFSWWLNDWAAAPGAYHKVRATGSDLDAMPQLDMFVIEFWGTLEILGDDATVM